MNIVLKIFGQLSGLSEVEVRDYLYLCEASMAHIDRITEGRDYTNGGVKAFAAAALTYYRYVLISVTDGDSDSVKIGEVSVNGNSKERLFFAERLYREALSQIGKGLDEEFVFEVV